MKWIVALAALLTAAPGPALIGSFPHDERAIVSVNCGSSSGSAFAVGGSNYVTAYHVVDDGACFVAGHRIEVTSFDRKRDYATFSGPPSEATIALTCEGFRPGTIYAARGFPGFAGTYNIFAPLLGIGLDGDGYFQFLGDFIPGMSGAPVLNQEGRAAGIVSRHSPARSMPLNNTGYCKA